jgi:outer membrane protein TolC
MIVVYDRKRPVLAGLYLLIPLCAAFAQQPVYYLPALVDSARQHFPELMQKQALLNSAEAALTDARHAFLPAVSVNEQVNLGTDNSIPGSYLSYGIIPSTSSGVRKDNNGQTASGNIAILAAQYDLVDFGYRRAFIENAESYVNLFRADREQALYNLKIQTARLYFNLLKNQLRLEVDRQNIERYEDIFTVIRAMSLSGIKPGADSSQARAELSKSRISYNQTLGQIGRLKEALAFFTGIPAERLQIDTATATYLDIRAQLRNQPVDSSRNPLLDYYESRQHTLLAQEKLGSKAYLPKIMLTANGWARGSSISYDDQFAALSQGLGFQRFNYLAGLSFQYGLFNGLHRRDRLRIYQFEAAAGDEALQQEKLSLYSTYRQAETAVQTAEANLSELPVQLTSAADVYAQKLAQYKAGLINLVDLTNAAFVLNRSQNDYTETLADWYLAQLDKYWSAGALDHFINSIK